VSDTSRWCRVHRVGRRSARSEAAGAGRTHTQDDDEHEVDVGKAVKLLEKIDRDERQVPERVLGRPNVVVLAGGGGVAVARVKRTKGQASEGEKITSDESPGTTRRRSEKRTSKRNKERPMIRMGQRQPNARPPQVATLKEEHGLTGVGDVGNNKHDTFKERGVGAQVVSSSCCKGRHKLTTFWI
jgi:hypothetical protein